ncbi:MAG: hypothetical protein WC329_02205 [Candidatus Omnitrophota bacterium]|jgi:hypothetical protein
MHFKEPPSKRVIVFVDGQNLYHSVKEAFGYTFPNYDIKQLFETVCKKYFWDMKQLGSIPEFLIYKTIPVGITFGIES